MKLGSMEFLLESVHEAVVPTIVLVIARHYGGSKAKEKRDSDQALFVAAEYRTVR